MATLQTIALGADWPRFLGPTCDRKAPDKGINKDWKSRPPKQLWKVDMADGGYSGPCIVGERLYITDHEWSGGNPPTPDVVRAIDLKTPKDVWRYKWPGSNYSSSGHSNCTPTFDNNRLYVFSRHEGELHCIDAQKGTKVWMHSMKKEFAGKPVWGYDMSPVIDGDHVIVCPCGPEACVAAFNKVTGALVWKGGGPDVCDSSTPIIATLKGTRRLLVYADKALMSLDPASGKLQWKVEPSKVTTHIPSPVIAGEDIFATAGYGTLCMMVSAEGKKLWENDGMMAHMNTPVYADGHLYGTTGQGTTEGALVCLDAKTGKVAWKQPGFEAGGVVAVDEVLIAVAGKTGDVAMVRLTPKAYEELGRIRPLGGRSWTPPVVADGKLYVRNEKALVCLDLK
jgi:outer membrane protein assembly factor BamB